MSNDSLFFSPSKLNLFLEVISKRRNGYHNLNSLMCFSDIGDYIEIGKSKNFTFKIKGDFASDLLGRENIISRAVFKLEEFLKIKINVQIILTKNLPISSGLAGGSSNAATTIKVIIKYLKLRIDKIDIDRILLSLGSDVPFCYYGKTSLVSGIGETLEPIAPLPEFHVLLVNPRIDIPTKMIFSRVKSFTKIQTDYPKKELNKKKIINVLLNTKNDLENVVKEIHPEIGLILKIFKEETNSIFFRMSGSGATCFAFFNKKEHLRSAEILFNGLGNHWWVKSGKILNYI